MGGKARRGTRLLLWHTPCWGSCLKTMGQKRILVVDDEEVLRELLADVLAHEGHHVDTASEVLSTQRLARITTMPSHDLRCQG